MKAVHLLGVAALVGAMFLAMGASSVSARASAVTPAETDVNATPLAPPTTATTGALNPGILPFPGTVDKTVHILPDPVATGGWYLGTVHPHATGPRMGAVAWDQPIDSFATPSSGMAGTSHWQQGKSGRDVIIVGEPIDSGTTYGTAPIEILPVAPQNSA